jgi:hypothetical protein
LVLFARNGTFQWVTANPNKKIFSPVTMWLKDHKSHFCCLAAGSPRAADSIWPAERFLPQIQLSRKQMCKISGGRGSPAVTVGRDVSLRWGQNLGPFWAGARRFPHRAKGGKCVQVSSRFQTTRQTDKIDPLRPGCGSGLTVTKVGQKVASVSLNIKSFCPPL